jgi:hypothetical protein
MTDFGLRHQLARNKLTLKSTTGFAFYTPNINWYLFTPPFFFADFPYVLLRLWEAPYGREPYERILGLFPGTPFVLLIFGMLIFKWFLKINKLNPIQNSINFPTKEFMIIIIPGLTILLFLMTQYYVTMRYVADYITLLLLAGIISWFYLYPNLIKGSLHLKVTNLFAYSSGLYSIIIGILASITGPYFGLLDQNNDEFRKLQILFFPISIFFHYFDKGI